jgi:hypothetical protein
MTTGLLFLEALGLTPNRFAYGQALSTAAQANSVAPAAIAAPKLSPFAGPDPVRQATEALFRWSKDWENRDFERFAAHYSEIFRSGSLDRQTYLDRKRTGFEKRPWHRVRIEEILWIAEQGTPDALTVRFLQNYNSPQGVACSRKEQQWVREGQRWQMASETEVALTESEIGSLRNKAVICGVGK